MTESEGSVRCPRGHLTAGGYAFCTTCGERLAPEAGSPAPADDPWPAPAPDSWEVPAADDLPPPASPFEPPPPASFQPPPSPGEPPWPDEPDDRVGFDLPPGAPLGPRPGPAAPKKLGDRLRERLGRKPRPAKGTAGPDQPGAYVGAGPSFFPSDAEPPADEPMPLDPASLDPPVVAAPLGSAPHADVEFAMGPRTRSITTPVPPDVSRPAHGGRRFRFSRDDIPTPLLAAGLVLAALIAVLVIWFLTRDPATPPVTTPLPTTGASPTGAPTPAVTAPAVTVSEECANAFAFAAAHATEPQAPSLQQRTLDLCTTRNEWLAAAALHPAAIGASSPAEVGDDDLARICSSVSTGSALCLAASTPAASAPAGAGAPTSPATSTATPASGGLVPSQPGAPPGP